MTRCDLELVLALPGGSDPELEWEETQLKARRLISIAGGALSDS